MKRLLIVCCTAFLAACGGGKGEFTAHIRGTVVDRPGSTTLLILRLYEDPRVTVVEIPIVDGGFSYDLVTDTREMWMLVFKDEMERGSMRPVYFFAEPGSVELNLHPMDRHAENTLGGGRLNRELAALQDSTEVWQARLREGGMALVERGYEPQRMSYGPEGPIIIEPDTSTPEKRALHEEFTALEARTLPGRELEHLHTHRSLVSLAMLYRNIKSELQWDSKGAEPYIEIYDAAGYAADYPDHPYTREIANLLGAVGSLKVGGRYIDLMLPDLDGKEMKLSELIEDRVALIDLWMTWCGPCRRSAMAAIPIYNEFRERGFTVVGVNGDGSLDAIREAARQDGYPWPTLVDLRGDGGVWSRYGITGAGGASYLVDRDGVILAINPNAEQLRKILEEKLL